MKTKTINYEPFIRSSNAIPLDGAVIDHPRKYLLPRMQSYWEESEDGGLEMTGYSISEPWDPEYWAACARGGD